MRNRRACQFSWVGVPSGEPDDTPNDVEAREKRGTGENPVITRTGYVYAFAYGWAIDIRVCVHLRVLSPWCATAFRTGVRTLPAFE